MQRSPIPVNDSDRVSRLRSYQILDTAAEKSFDDLAQLAALILEVPISLVSLIDLDRQWFKAKVGMPQEHIPRESSFCGYTICGSDLMIVQDAHEDVRFRDNLLVRGDPHIRFYVGAPLTTEDGYCIGTLSCFDRRPRQISPLQQEALLTLSAQVVAQIELRRNFREVRAARDALVELQHQRQSLVDFVTHDMKNALQIMLGYAGVLECSDTLHDNDRLALSKVKRSGRIMDRMVRDMLDISRDEQARMPVEPTSIDVGSLFTEVAESYSLLLKDRNLSVRIEASDDSTRAWADLDLIRRVLENLIDNDLKYVPPGGLISLRTRVVEAGWLDIFVDDNGPGIPAIERERIFDKYARTSDGNEGQARRSFGLGLAFCRIAIESCGGKIWVDDVSPHGSSFHLRLPAELLLKTQPAPKAAASVF